MHIPRIKRRTALKLFAGGAASAAAPMTSRLLAGQAPPARTGLGLVVYCCRLRREASRRKSPGFDLFEPLQFLEHCRRLGAGGMQVRLGVLQPNEARELRRQVDEAEMYLEAIVRPPFEAAEIERFDAELRTAAAAGALAARTTIIPGRRYEYFDSLAHFQEYDARGRRALERAAPIAERRRLPLAVENHKDHRDEQRLALFEQISSEYVGACVDTGNSFALLNDPLKTVEMFAPWAHSVHLKDQAVQLNEDGFLLGDIPLGQGFLDLPQMVRILKQERPKLRFSLELITRDPLKVPCLTEKYWATFPDLPGRELARTLRAVRDGASDNLQSITSLSSEEQVGQEDANVRASLDYARDTLQL